ncbi:MAG: hypothetical protein PVF15_07710 [Candidatus Bathyarchaeota archaeon]|jgi:hypothetical protein
MEWKMLEAKSGFRSARERLLKLIRPGKEDSSVPLLDPLPAAPHKLANSRANRLLEVELNKAQALMYMRRFDRPK